METKSRYPTIHLVAVPKVENRENGEKQKKNVPELKKT